LGRIRHAYGHAILRACTGDYFLSFVRNEEEIITLIEYKFRFIFVALFVYAMTELLFKLNNKLTCVMMHYKFCKVLSLSSDFTALLF